MDQQGALGIGCSPEPFLEPLGEDLRVVADAALVVGVIAEAEVIPAPDEIDEADFERRDLPGPRAPQLDLEVVDPGLEEGGEREGERIGVGRVRRPGRILGRGPVFGGGRGGCGGRSADLRSVEAQLARARAHDDLPEVRRRLLQYHFEKQRTAARGAELGTRHRVVAHLHRMLVGRRTRDSGSAEERQGQGEFGNGTRHSGHHLN